MYVAAAQVSRVAAMLASAPPAPPGRDAELLAEAVAAIKAEPGQLKTPIANRLRGEMQRRLAAVDRAVAAGLIHTRPLVPVHGSRTGYHPGPALEEGAAG